MGKNWQISGTSGMSYRIEALQIQIVKKETLFLLLPDLLHFLF
ncbi:hypothetical protein OBG91_03345 [Lactococcus lactis]|nr:hypothetical protein [Lactococcus lactis]